MCTYSAQDGHATDWHLVNLGTFATRGVGAITVEATAVVPEGRITPGDLGLWSDDHVAPLSKIVQFSHAHDTKIGIQLAHAGRKASNYIPWVQKKAPKGSYIASAEEGGWPENLQAPSAIAFSKSFGNPRELSIEEIDGLVQSFVDAATRAKSAGFDFIEIHSAHGFLIHEFLSPLSNHRTDEYGGSFENRTRFLLKAVKAVRAQWGDQKPIFVRISATDWFDGSERDQNGEWQYWGPEQTTLLAAELSKAGVDLVDVSSGGNWEAQKIPVKPDYQAQFSQKIKKAVPELAVGAVGLITEPEQAENYLQNGTADAIFMARELLRNPHWPLFAARKLGVRVKPAHQYERAWL